MTWQEAREKVANKVKPDNPAFKDQIRRGEQDDGPYMQGALAIWEALIEWSQPAPEEIEA